MMFPSIGRKIQPEPDAPAIAADSMSLAVEPSVTFQPQANSAAPLTPPDLTNLDDLMTDAPTTFEPTVPQTSSVSFDMSSDEKPVLDLDLSNSSTAVNSIDDDAKTADSETDATTNVGSVASSESDLPATPAVLTTSIKDPAPVSGTHAHHVHDNDLEAIKKQALQDLAPLVSHLEGEPEDRYQTIMSMLRASDDSSLIASAYAAARDITDEKLRATSLLEIVNEINFLSQPK
jgi:hypothetical protein